MKKILVTVDMAPDDRGEAGDIGAGDACAFGGDLAQGFLHVDRIPMDDGVEGEAEGAGLILLSLAQRIADFAALAVMDSPSETMAQFLAVELDQDAVAKGGIINIAQDVNGFNDSSEFRQGAGEAGRSLT